MKKAKLLMLLGAVFVLSLSSCSTSSGSASSSSNSSSSSSETVTDEETDSEDSVTSETDGETSSSSEENPGGDQEQDPYPTYQAYSYVVDNSDFNASGGTFTKNGLTWTYDNAISISKDSSGRGIQIGTSNSPQSNPWTISTDFEELVQLNSVIAYLYTSTGSGLTAHYEISFGEESIDSGDYHSSNSSDVTLAGKEQLSYEGSKLTLSINAVNSTAFYLQAIVISVHTAKDSALVLSTDEGYYPSDSGYEEPEEEEEEPDYSIYGDTYPDDEGVSSIDLSYYHAWSVGDGFPSEYISSNKLSKGSSEFNGLTWSWNACNYINIEAANGIHIGSSSFNVSADNPFTLTAHFGENIVVTGFSIVLTTAASGNCHVDVSVDDKGKDTSILSDNTGNVYGDFKEYEFDDLNIRGQELSISLYNATNSSRAVYFYSVGFTLLVFEDTKLEFSQDEYNVEKVVPGVTDKVPQTNYNLSDCSVEAYYSSYNLELEGDCLQEELCQATELQTKMTYGDARYSLLYIDEYPEQEGYIYGAYDGDKLPAVWDSGSSWQREHVWPCAQMDASGDNRPGESTIARTSDLHNLRVSCARSNLFKSDKYFDNENSSEAFYPNCTASDYGGSHSFEGDHRGDVARICLYMYVRYGKYNTDEGLTLDLSNTIEDNTTMGVLDSLLAWNLLDPVDDFETERNNRIYEYQGNRNPFIDYPCLAYQLFPDFDTSAYVN